MAIALLAPENPITNWRLLVTNPECHVRTTLFWLNNSIIFILNRCISALFFENHSSVNNN